MLSRHSSCVAHIRKKLMPFQVEICAGLARPACGAHIMELLNDLAT
jgi:hypothetical protein